MTIGAETAPTTTANPNAETTAITTAEGTDTTAVVMIVVMIVVMSAGVSVSGVSGRDLIAPGPEVVVVPTVVRTVAEAVVPRAWAPLCILRDNLGELIS